MCFESTVSCECFRSFKKHTLAGRTSPLSPYKGVLPPPQPGGCGCCINIQNMMQLVDVIHQSQKVLFMTDVSCGERKIDMHFTQHVATWTFTASGWSSICNVIYGCVIRYKKIVHYPTAESDTHSLKCLRFCGQTLLQQSLKWSRQQVCRN